MNARWSMPWWLLWALAITLVVGCSVGVAQAIAGSGSASPAASKVVLKIGWTDDPDNLNPYIGYASSSYEVWSLQYDWLFNAFPDGSYGPQLASEIPTTANGGISADGTVWTVHIRSGVKWQDGQSLTAKDVAFSYTYVIDTPMQNWNMMTTGIDKVVAVDPTTIRFFCSRPKADFLKSAVPIVPEHIWGKIRGSAAQNNYQSKPPIVGSGPFQVVELKKGAYVKMVRNPLYWGQQPTVDEILFEDFQNADTMTQELKLGTIDAAEGLPVAQFKMLQGDKQFGTIAWNLLTVQYLAFNCYAGPSTGNSVLRDPAFRRALVYAIDQKTLINVAWAGLAAPGTTVIEPHTWSNPDWYWQPPADQAYTFDLAKAGQMLDVAGYPLKNGVRVDKNGKPITLRLWTLTESEPDQSAGKLIAGRWKQIGIRIRLEVLDRGALDDRFWNYQGNTYVPDYDVYIDEGVGFLDPGQTLALFTTSQIGNWNDACWSNPAYDALATAQASEMDLSKRQQMLYKMQEMLYGNAVQPGLVYPEALQAYSTERWTGWTPLKLAGAPGPVFFSAYNIDTYLNLKPSAQSTRSSGTALVTAIAVALVAVVALVVWIVIRRRSRPKEEVGEA